MPGPSESFGPGEPRSPDDRPPPPPPGSAEEALRRLEQRLDRASEAAERLMAQAAEAAAGGLGGTGARGGTGGTGAPAGTGAHGPGPGAAGPGPGAADSDPTAASNPGATGDPPKPPTAGWQFPDNGRAAIPDLDPFVALAQALRELVPPDLRRRLAAAIRELLLAVRALIDWYLERLERRREQAVEVQDIPIL
jgi:hypothetical protein